MVAGYSIDPSDQASGIGSFWQVGVKTLAGSMNTGIGAAAAMDPEVRIVEKLSEGRLQYTLYRYRCFFGCL